MNSAGAASVLVVDDSTANLVALGAVLQPLDIRVVEARSGAEAIERVHVESFAVALVDVQMPEMDGFELAARLREMPHGRQMPIVFLTAIHRDETYQRKGYASGAADYITKPFDPDVVRARVKAFVDLYQQRDRVRLAEVGERTRERDEAYERLAELLESERVARRQAELANRTKDEFLATVSHELRTPLSAILGWAAIARRGGPGVDIQKILATIERNARAQMRLIEDVLDVGRMVGGKLSLRLLPTQVGAVVESAVTSARPAAEAKKVSLTMEIARDVGTVQADPLRLEQIVGNLVHNAIKFTPSGGHVRVSCSVVASRLILRVTDDGEGISPDFFPHLFETFRQADGSVGRRHGGLGLGLAIVDALAQAHGGSVSARSDGLGKGATFTVDLPLTPGAARAAPVWDPASERAPERLDGVRVLVVDDDEDTRDLLTVMLGELGALVTVATSADEAMSALARRSPDVLVSDIGMPDMSGYAFIERVRSLPAERGGLVPAIALTAYARSEDAVRARKAGFQAHLTKPIDPDRLTRVVAELAES